MYNSCLVINNLELDVFLGVTKQERSSRQKISVDIKIFFTNLPKSCATDNIIETECYDRLTKLILNFCHDKEFKLIERLAYQLHNLVLQNLQFAKNLLIKVRKLNPPIKEVKGSTDFIYHNIEYHQCIQLLD